MNSEQTFREYLRATKSHDLAGTLELIADDAIYLFSNETCHVGKAEIKSAIEHNFKTIRNESYDITGLKWLARSAELAVCVYEFHWAGDIQDRQVSGSGRATCVLKCENDAWKIAHEHLSRGALSSEDPPRHSE